MSIPEMYFVRSVLTCIATTQYCAGPGEPRPFHDGYLIQHHPPLLEHADDLGRTRMRGGLAMAREAKMPEPEGRARAIVYASSEVHMSTPKAVKLLGLGRGLYVHDANLMLGLARAQFGSNAAAAARATLEELYRENPDFRSPEGQLLYARALEGEGAVQKALEQYRALANSYPGAEAAVRYAQLLETHGASS